MNQTGSADTVVPSGTDTSTARLSGRTTVSERALRRLADAILTDALRADAPYRAFPTTSVTLADDAGALRCTVSVTLTPGGAGGRHLIALGDEIRRALTTGMPQLAARRVSSVDVRFLGAAAPAERVLR